MAGRTVIAASTEAVSMSVEKVMPIEASSGTSVAASAGSVATTRGEPTVAKAKGCAASDMTLPARSRAPARTTTRNWASSGSGPAGVKVSVVPLHENEPSIAGSVLNAASAEAWSTASENVTTMLVVVSATDPSAARCCVSSTSVTSGGRESTVLAT